MDQVIIKETEERSYFTMLPNIIDDSDLDPYEVRLLLHYYRINDKCYESNKTTCAKCQMGESTMRKKRKSLADKGWISLEHTLPPEQGRGQTIIIVLDKWHENYLHFKPDEPHVTDSTPPALSEHPPALSEHHKNNNIKNNNNLKDVSNDTSKKTNDDWHSLLSHWQENFPDKPQPRKDNETLRGKFRTRMKKQHFRESWQEAISIAGKSKFLHESRWFDIYWFLRNDDHYERCLSGKYGDDTKALGSKVRVADDGGFYA